MKTDLALLARKRWIEGESTKVLAVFFEVKEESIKGYLRRLKDHRKLKALGILNSELPQIYEGMAKG